MSSPEPAVRPRRLARGTQGIGKVPAILVAVGIVLGLAGLVLLTPSLSPLPSVRDSDADGVVDAYDFMKEGDGGVRISVDDLEVMGLFLVVNGNPTCLNEAICPSASFRVATDVGVYSAAFITDGAFSLDIPDDTRLISFLVEVALDGGKLNSINDQRHVHEAPFGHRDWSFSFVELSVWGNLSYSIAPVRCPCIESYLEGNPEANLWPGPQPPPAPQLEISVALSANGVNWILTVTSVSVGVAPSSVSLVIFASDGTVWLARTALTALSGVTEAYVQIDASATSMGVGDRILLAVATYPAGSTYQLVDDKRVLASGILPSGPQPPPPQIEISVGQSSNGLNWVLTFAAVPAGMANASVFLSIFDASGALLFAATTLDTLNGVSETYSPITGGSSLSAGDRILLAVATYPAGSIYQLTDANGVLASGILQ